ncbi:hypothetical protein VMCG_02203 [Cytospora schulzeri]|uniref:Transcription factor domain-containing protein n=1 Tax=Cytospora schulzeri TaxID=448051 RepID=A0A423X0Z7_9PEZI|nr:hypothetical protein VMCG_02203 [Valsa malicola]
MSDYYHDFLCSVSGIGGNPDPNAQDGTVPGHVPTPFSIRNNMVPSTFHSTTYYSGLPEQITFQAPKPQRSKRKSATGTDHIKHRRTRSCRKGKRDCLYPEPPTKSSSPQGPRDTETNQQASPTSSPEDNDDDVDQDTKLSPIPDEDEESPTSVSQHLAQPRKGLRHMSTASSLNLKRLMTRTRQSSEAPSLEGTKSSSPTVSVCTASSYTPTTSQLSDLPWSMVPDLSHLPTELHFYLEYFYDNITHHHYGAHKDFGDFFRTTFISLAVRSEPLLNAIVAFAAYHHTIRDPNGKLPSFLKYYNRSVTLLLDLLKSEERHDLWTLLTVLQLATIEEYLGDWVNLMGHQRAALQILTQLFTPGTMAQTSMNRTILAWYTRFDILVSSMGGFETSLPRVWYSTLDEHCLEQLASDPDDLDCQYEASENQLRLISVDLCSLVAKRARGELRDDVFVAEHMKVANRLQEWKANMEPALTDPARLVPSTSGAIDRYSNAYPDQVPIYDAPLSTTTLLICEWHSMVMMYMYQVMGDTQEPVAAGLGDLTQHAQAICQVFEAAEQWSSVPKGLLVMLHPCLAIASLFLPRTPAHNTWLRHKFAFLERSGYIFPVSVRKRMAEHLQDGSIVRWWLPDEQGFSPIMQSIRAFADERNATAVSAQSENLGEMKTGFAAMRLGGDASPIAAGGMGGMPGPL